VPGCACLHEECALQLELAWDEAARQWLVAEMNINGGYRTPAAPVPPHYVEGLGVPSIDTDAGEAWLNAQCAWEAAAEQCVDGGPASCQQYLTLLVLVHQAAERYAAYNALVGRTAEWWVVAGVGRYPRNACLYATLAYEDTVDAPPDLMRRDRDYNDWVVYWHAVELYSPCDSGDGHHNCDRELRAIGVDHRPKARGSWFRHSMHWAVDGRVDAPTNLLAETRSLLNGNAALAHVTRRLQHIDVAESCTLETWRHVEPVSTHNWNAATAHDLVMFNSTHAAHNGYIPLPPTEFDRYINTMRNKTQCEPATVTSSLVVLTPQSPAHNVAPYDRNVPPATPDYYFYVHAEETQRDLTYVMFDLGIACIFNAEDALDPVLGDGDGLEWPTGLSLPVAWRWPYEFEDITAAYPGFTELLQWLNDPQMLAPAHRAALEHWWQPTPPVGDDAVVYPWCALDAPLP
jgi:hypothetical protein